MLVAPAMTQPGYYRKHAGFLETRFELHGGLCKEVRQGEGRGEADGSMDATGFSLGYPVVYSCQFLSQIAITYMRARFHQSHAS